jgi:hypothetical protein
VEDELFDEALMKTPEAAPWLKWIQEGTLARWSNDIVVYDADNVAGEGTSSESIVVGDKMQPTALFDLMASTGIQHFVQVSNPKFDHALNFSASLIQEPDKFIESPHGVFFASRGRTPEEIQTKKFPFRHSRDKLTILEELRQHLLTIPKIDTIRDSLIAISDEMYTNVMFNAPIDQNGFTKYAKVARNASVSLDDGKEGAITLAHDGRTMMIYCEDNYGSANPEMILGRIRDCFKLGISGAMRMQGAATGIGCYMMYEHSNTFIVAVRPRQKTVIACTLLMGLPAKLVTAIPKNLHVVYARS